MKRICSIRAILACCVNSIRSTPSHGLDPQRARQNDDRRRMSDHVHYGLHASEPLGQWRERTPGPMPIGMPVGSAALSPTVSGKRCATRCDTNIEAGTMPSPRAPTGTTCPPRCAGQRCPHSVSPGRNPADSRHFWLAVGGAHPSLLTARPPVSIRLYTHHARPREHESPLISTTNRDAATVAANLRRLMARDGLTFDDVVAASGLDERTLRASSAARATRTPARCTSWPAVWAFRSTSCFARRARAAARNSIGPPIRWSNAVVAAHSDLFENWSDADFDELYSRFGTGGQLTEAGVLAAAEAMNAKRDLGGRSASSWKAAKPSCSPNSSKCSIAASRPRATGDGQP